MSYEIRDTLFGDMAMEAWPAGESDTQPWASFGEARRAMGAGDGRAAEVIWRRVLEPPGLETRHYLQAWCFLRQAGVTPDDVDAKEVLGVVIEVPIGPGLDLLAAYRDGTAQYHNHAGGAVVGGRPDSRLDSYVDGLLAAGRDVVERIGPWEGARPEPPSEGLIRLNFLTPAGLHFGQAPLGLMASDPTGGPVVSAGLALMELLVGLPPNHRTDAP